MIIKKIFRGLLVSLLMGTTLAIVLSTYYEGRPNTQEISDSEENTQVEAITMLSDGKEIATIKGEAEGNKVLDLVKNYYISKSKLNVKEAKIKNNITYNKTKVLPSKISKPEIVAINIENNNINSKNPLISFQIKGTLETNETLSPATVITYSKDLIIGESKIKSSGENGTKATYREVTLENTSIKDMKLVSEKIITAPKDKIILKGTKNPLTSSSLALATPSRGTISSSFGMRWGKMHKGIDIAAPIGTTIYAALSGTVTYAGWEEGYGNVIKLIHDNGLETIYGHCSSISVSKGSKVTKGGIIGKVGSTGNSTGPHLHFEVRVNGEPKNPIEYLK